MSSTFFWLTIYILGKLGKLSVSYSFTKLADCLLESIRNSKSIKKKPTDSIWDCVRRANSRAFTACDCLNKGYLDKANKEFKSAIRKYHNAYDRFNSDKDNLEERIITVHCDLLLGICSGFIGDWESYCFHINRGKNCLATVIEGEKQKVTFKRDKGNRDLRKIWSANFVVSGASLATGVVISPLVVPAFALSPVCFGLSFLNPALPDNIRVEAKSAK